MQNEHTVVTDYENCTKDFITAMDKLKKSSFPTPKGFHYHSPEEFVLENGTQYQVDYKTLNRFGVKAPKRCYQNAADYVLDHPGQGLTYVEGYVTTVIPIMHAWVVDKDGVIADVTIKVDGRKEEFYPRDYFGVEIPTVTLMSLLNYTGKYGLLDAWQSEWPLFKQRWDPKKVGMKYSMKTPLRCVRV